jgi:hypothetical protein
MNERNDDGTRLHRLTLRLGAGCGALLVLLGVHVGFPDRFPSAGTRSIIAWAAAAGVAVLVLILMRAILTDLRSGAEAAPRTQEGTVESRAWAMLVGAFYCGGLIASVRLLAKILHLSVGVQHAIGPAVLAALVLVGASGLVGALGLMRWEQRRGVLLVRLVRVRPSQTRRGWWLRRSVGVGESDVLLQFVPPSDVPATAPPQRA